MVPKPCQVQRIRRETGDVVTLDVAPGDGDTSFCPGQFNMLYVFGVGEVPISISGDPSRRSLLVHTVRSAGAVTQALTKLKRGDTVGLRGPFGSAWPMTEAQENDVLIVSGGLGLAPLRPAIYSLLSNREKYGRVTLLYGARTPQDMLYSKELHDWRSRFDLEVEVTVDRAESGWRGHVGVVTGLIPKSSFDPINTLAFVCGPEVMMRYTLLELQKQGLSPEHIYLSMERNMKCAIGFCGHCQFGPYFI
ncbi:MAG: FAD/NAD(P)-binding protein, partial [Dehalococcoidia bacterium]